MLKFHSITAFNETYTNFTKYFGKGFLVKISILDIMLLPKKSVFHLNGYITVALTAVTHLPLFTCFNE